MLLAESTRLLSLILPSLSHFSQFPNCGGLNTIQQATLTCRIASECFIPALMYYIEYAFTGFISSMKAIARAHWALDNSLMPSLVPTHNRMIDAPIVRRSVKTPSG